MAGLNAGHGLRPVEYLQPGQVSRLAGAADAEIVESVAIQIAQRRYVAEAEVLIHRVDVGCVRRLLARIGQNERAGRGQPGVGPAQQNVDPPGYVGNVPKKPSKSARMGLAMATSSNPSPFTSPTTS